MPSWSLPRKSGHGCGGNRTQSRREHITDSHLKTQRYCDQLDAKRRGFKNGRRIVAGGPKVHNWGKSRFPVGGINADRMSSRRIYGH